MQDLHLALLVSHGHLGEIHVQARQLGLPGAVAHVVKAGQQGVQALVAELLAQFHMLQHLAAGLDREGFHIVIAGGVGRQAGGPDHVGKAQAGQHGAAVIAQGVLFQQGAGVLHQHAGPEFAQGADGPGIFCGQQGFFRAVDVADLAVKAADQQAGMVFAAQGQALDAGQADLVEVPQIQAHIHAQVGGAAGIEQLVFTAGQEVETGIVGLVAHSEADAQQLFGAFVADGQAFFVFRGVPGREGRGGREQGDEHKGQKNKQTAGMESRRAGTARRP